MKPDIRPDTGYKKGRISGTTKYLEDGSCSRESCHEPDGGGWMELGAADHRALVMCLVVQVL